MRRWLERFLKSLEKANKESFGDRRMDCCDLNKKSNSIKTTKNKED